VPELVFRLVADLRAQHRQQAHTGEKEIAAQEREAAKIRREVDRLVNALALTDEKPDAIVGSISVRQARLRELENQIAGAKAAPKAVEEALTSLVENAYAAIKRFNETIANNPNQAREVVAAAFDKITFTPEKTPDGPRYRLEGTGNLGRLLGLDDDAKWASPAGH
jgi:septal ring factor EnvC (AmiA/AmiB activator)